MSVRPPKPHLAPPFSPTHRLDDHDVVTLPLPGYRQVRSYSCGFASALMVVRYFDLEVPGHDLYRRLGTDRSGTRQTAIVRALRRLGLRAGLRYDAGFESLTRAIDAGKVVIGYLHDVEHWLVLYGYGRAPDRVFVADPRPGHSCEQLWDAYGSRLGRFGIFCSRPGAEAPAPRPRFELAGEPPPRTPEPAPRPLPGAQLSLDFGGS